MAVHSLRVPIDGTSVGEAAVYAVPLDDGVALVDAGWPSDAAWTAFTAALDDAGVAMKDIRHVLITHAGHTCFLHTGEDVLFTGDHLLARITPNVGQQSIEDGSQPLADFLASVRLVAALGARRALPAHGPEFDDVAGRAAQIEGHHERRLTDVAALVAERPGISGYDVARRLRWAKPWDAFTPPMRRSAVGEALAHLVHLRGAGLIHSSDDLVVRWYPIA